MKKKNSMLGIAALVAIALVGKKVLAKSIGSDTATPAITETISVPTEHVEPLYDAPYTLVLPLQNPDVVFLMESTGDLMTVLNDAGTYKDFIYVIPLYSVLNQIVDVNKDWIGDIYKVYNVYLQTVGWEKVNGEDAVRVRIERF